MRLVTFTRGIAVAAAAFLGVVPALAQSKDMPKDAPKVAPAQATPATPATPSAFDQPFNPSVARRITAEEIKQRIEKGEKVIIIDTRSGFTGPMAKDANRVTTAEVANWAKDKPKDAFIVAYCT